MQVHQNFVRVFKLEFEEKKKNKLFFFFFIEECGSPMAPSSGPSKPEVVKGGFDVYQSPANEKSNQ